MRDRATMLQFDWEEVDGALVTAVVAKGARALSDGSLSCEEIALVLGAQAVVLRVNEDTDEIGVRLENLATDHPEWQALAQLREIVSHRLGWCWVGRNYRGYLDLFMISINGIDPCYGFVGVASGLHCTRVTSISA